jgi:hypothetical protein
MIGSYQGNEMEATEKLQKDLVLAKTFLIPAGSHKKTTPKGSINP